MEEPGLEAGIEPGPDRKDDEDESLQPSRRGSYVSRLQSRRSSIQSPVLQAEAIQAYAADVWAAAV